MVTDAERPRAIAGAPISCASRSAASRTALFCAGCYRQSGKPAAAAGREVELVVEPIPGVVVVLVEPLPVVVVLVVLPGVVVIV